jgi:hypothetical protein
MNSVRRDLASGDDSAARQRRNLCLSRLTLTLRTVNVKPLAMAADSRTLARMMPMPSASSLLRSFCSKTWPRAIEPLLPSGCPDRRLIVCIDHWELDPCAGSGQTRAGHGARNQPAAMPHQACAMHYKRRPPRLTGVTGAAVASLNGVLSGGEGDDAWISTLQLADRAEQLSAIQGQAADAVPSSWSAEPRGTNWICLWPSLISN